jgi:hypothetical protein
MNPGQIFLGKVPSKFLTPFGHILQELQDRYERVVIPAIGEFGVAEVAVKAGYAPAHIYTSDLVLNPPSIKKGYDKIFSFNDQISWKQPAIPHFDVKEGLEELRDIMANAQCLTFMYGTDRNMPFVGNAVIAVEARNGVPATMVVNRLEEIAPKLRVAIPYTGPKSSPAKFPVWTDQNEIRPDSTFQLVRISQENALYYRNLWIHRLGATTARTYTGWLIDGRIAGVVGWSDDKIWNGRETKIYESFGISAPSKRYPRLNRLMMMQLVSRPTCDQLMALFYDRNPMITIDGMKTTCLTAYRERRSNKDLFRELSCEKLPNDTYKLKYETEWHERDYAECLRLWIEETNAPKATGAGENRRPRRIRARNLEGSH